MKLVTRSLVCTFVVLQIFVGLSIGFHISDLWSSHGEDTTKKYDQQEVISLKAVKAKFATLNSAEIDNYLNNDITIQTSIVEDPKCPPGFRRDRRGICREVW